MNSYNAPSEQNVQENNDYSPQNNTGKNQPYDNGPQENNQYQGGYDSSYNNQPASNQQLWQPEQ